MAGSYALVAWGAFIPGSRLATFSRGFFAFFFRVVENHEIKG
jgi:hypothetical protein